MGLGEVFPSLNVSEKLSQRSRLIVVLNSNFWLLPDYYPGSWDVVSSGNDSRFCYEIGLCPSNCPRIPKFFGCKEMAYFLVFFLHLLISLAPVLFVGLPWTPELLKVKTVGVSGMPLRGLYLGPLVLR